MLMPKRTKFRKQHRGKMIGCESRSTEVQFGEFNLQVLEPAWVTSCQIEAVKSGRRARKAG